MNKRRDNVGIAMKNALGQDIPLSLERKKGFTSLFMNVQRRKLYCYLCSFPGSNMRMISRDMGIGLPSVRWHLDHLKESGFVDQKAIGKFKVFYPCKLVHQDFLEVYALLNKEQARTIFKLVIQKGGISHQQLSEEALLSPQNLGGWIKKFVHAELIAPIKDGRNNRYYPTVRISEIEKVERKYRTGFKRFILNKLHQDGVNPRISMSTSQRYVLRISVGGDAHHLKLYLTPMKTIIDGRKQFIRDFTSKEGLQGSLGGKKGKSRSAEESEHHKAGSAEDERSSLEGEKDSESLSRKFRRIMKENK